MSADVDDDTGLDPDFPADLEASAADLREIGYDDLADRLVNTADKARELLGDD